MAQQLIRAPEVLQRFGCRKSFLYDQIKAGMLTPPVRLSGRFVAWPAAEIDKIVDARVAGVSAASVRALVAELVQARQQA